MKVLHVNTHMNIGGIGQYILSLCGAIRDEGVDCIVASSGGPLEDDMGKNAIRHMHIDIRTKFEFGPKVFKAASSLKDIIKKERIDIVHAHTRVSQVASVIASRSSGIHYVSTCHGFFKPHLSRRLFDTWGEKVVAISEPVKAHLERDFGVDAGRIKLIHNGIDMDRFSRIYSDDELAKIRRSIGLEEGPVIGTIGRLSPVKGQRFLIEAMKYITSESYRAQCMIIGAGPEEHTLKDLTRNLGLGGQIKFVGGISYRDVPLYLACLDVFVLPSVKEGLGLSLAEAMAAGRPCVASDIGGVVDIVKDGVNGILAPVADTRAIADAVSRLLNDKMLSSDLGRRGKVFVEENFSIDLMARKMRGLYKEIMNEKQ